MWIRLFITGAILMSLSSCWHIFRDEEYWEFGPIRSEDPDEKPTYYPWAY